MLDYDVNNDINQYNANQLLCIIISGRKRAKKGKKIYKKGVKDVKKIKEKKKVFFFGPSHPVFNTRHVIFSTFFMNFNGCVIKRNKYK